MKYLALFLSLLLGNRCASAASASVQTRGLEQLCPSAVAVNSTAFSVNGNAIQRTTFACPGRSLSSRANVQALSPVLVPSSLTELSSRNVDECKTSAPECQCGQPTSCVCNNPTPDAPTGNDCAILIDSMRIIPQLDGATFVVHSKTFELIQFQSCAIEWSNLATATGIFGVSRDQPLEFCWDEAVALMGLSNQDCLENDTSSGATCTPNNGLWNLRIFRISS